MPRVPRRSLRMQPSRPLQRQRERDPPEAGDRMEPPRIAEREIARPAGGEREAAHARRISRAVARALRRR